jgi:hypothetical protein
MQRVYEAMPLFAKPVKQDFTFKQCEVRDLNPRSRAWEARTLTRLGQPRL